MAAGTWQHHHRHLLKTHRETDMRQVNNGQKTTRLSIGEEEREHPIKGEAAYWTFSLGAVMHSNFGQTTPFHLWPRCKVCERAAATLLFGCSWFIPFHFRKPPQHSPPLPPSGAPLRTSHLFPTPSTGLAPPLTGRAAVDDTYPAESSHAGSMDRNTLRGQTTQLSRCVCVCFLSIFILEMYEKRTTCSLTLR